MSPLAVFLFDRDKEIDRKGKIGKDGNHYSQYYLNIVNSIQESESRIQNNKISPDY
jgi:hypothetical protein